jgi:hypothetical protein
MDPMLNNESTPIYFERCPTRPAGFDCAGAYLSPLDQCKRDAAFVRAEDTLLDDMKKQIPGIPRSKVGILACGIRSFTDGLSPYKRRSKSANAFCLTVTNWHPAVAQSPRAVALGGVYFSPEILKATKVLKTDVGHSASPATMARAAIAEDLMLLEIVGIPLKRLLTRRCLILRTASLRGLPADFPQVCGASFNKPSDCSALHRATHVVICLPLQYAALVFYLSAMQADLPLLYKLVGKSEHWYYTPFDGVCNSKDAKKLNEVRIAGRESY